ncbi:MAG: response regulator [Verrucomicrobia bacterium]|nr:response regulator [Verrucomicrobiota bacterium]
MARIVLIDDDDVFRETLAVSLQDCGHTVTTANNGFDGTKQVRTQGADVLITDIEMPYGGLPTIRVLRAEFPMLPIIAISGHSVRLDVAASIGANYALGKPFVLADLANAVTTVTAGHVA